MQITRLSKQERNELTDDIMKWVLFSVVFTISPPFFYYAYRMIVGYDINYQELVPDVMLVLLALSLNLLNQCIDYKKIIQRFLWWIGCCFFSLVAFFCWGIYILHEFEIKPKNAYASQIFKISKWIVVFYFLVGIGLKYLAKRKKYS